MRWRISVDGTVPMCGIVPGIVSAACRHPSSHSRPGLASVSHHPPSTTLIALTSLIFHSCVCHRDVPLSNVPMIILSANPTPSIIWRMIRKTCTNNCRTELFSCWPSSLQEGNREKLSWSFAKRPCYSTSCLQVCKNNCIYLSKRMIEKNDLDHLK